WDPARIEVSLRHPAVVAVEEREEILREVALVDLGEGAHDPEIERYVAPLQRSFGSVGSVPDVDQDVSRVHVRMKEPVAKHLGEEYLDTGTRERGNIDAPRAQLVDLGDRRSMHPLHHHD